ncbi:MAG: EAL domain-containing response regulator [Holophaga sp.]
MNQHPSIRILILDDESFMLKLLAHMLASQGFSQVTTCDRASIALERLDLTDAPPELILCDLNMPGMDGIEFIRQLVGRRYAGSLILVSGEDDRVMQAAERLVREHRLHVLGHLQKPVTPESLGALLSQWAPAPKGRTRTEKKCYTPDRIRSAIASGELVNHYQPKVEVATRKVLGVESLVRWRHPEDGLVYPSQFISLAEGHGLIDELTRKVLTMAIGQAKAWHDAGRNVSTPMRQIAA